MKVFIAVTSVHLSCKGCYDEIEEMKEMETYSE